ncbi:MAG: hypothetical protein M0015_10860 [Betaproteobacteria bacterium]|nr:hypothetical protein [Betaproteobacteria bacterium]
MKFTIRSGFVILLPYADQEGAKLVEINGKEMARYTGGQGLELTAEQTEAHRHKLEPADAEAAKFLADRVARAFPAPSA